MKGICEKNHSEIGENNEIPAVKVLNLPNMANKKARRLLLYYYSTVSVGLDTLPYHPSVMLLP